MYKIIIIFVFLMIQCNPLMPGTEESTPYNVTLSFSVLDSNYHTNWAWLCADSSEFFHPEPISDTIQLTSMGIIDMYHSYRSPDDTLQIWISVSERFLISSDTIIHHVFNCGREI